MSQKYRQPGYQDDDAGESRREPGVRRERGEAPRGRGLGAPGSSVFRCRDCGAHAEVKTGDNTAVCDGCGTDLHTCTHCRHFDTAAVNECRVEAVEPVANKAKANQCSSFEARQAIESESESKRGTDTKSAFDELFNF